MPKFIIEQDGDRYEVQAKNMEAAMAGLGMHVKAAGTSKPAVGLGESVARGAMQGATANFSDELFALSKAGGGGVDDPRMGIDHLIGGAIKYFTGDKGAEAAYDAEVAKERERNKQAAEEHPVAYTAGEVGGAMALPTGAGGAAASIPAKMAVSALTGGAMGALSGAGQGETLEQRAVSAGSGGGVGAAVGAFVPPAVQGVAAVGKKALAPVVNQFRGVFDVDAEAGRRVVTALQRDAKADPTAANRLTPAEFANEPSARVVDAGGELTRRLADSAAITSPEGANALKNTISDRFSGQNSRIVDWFNNSFNFPDADATTSALREVAKTVNKGAYAKAHAQPAAKAMWDEGFEQLMQAPAMQEAARAATSTGANRSAMQGFTPVQKPFEFHDTGSLTPRYTQRTDNQGRKILPNLEFWDNVKRNLDDKISSLQRSGEKSAARDVQELRSALVDKLDKAVPDYAAARAGAARFFGAEDALEAGKTIVASKMNNREIARGLAKMSPVERKLAQDGFVDQFIQSIKEVGDSRSVLNKINESTGAKERLRMVLGEAKAQELEAKLRVEGIMDRVRTAVTGNSWTAQRLFNLGLAGGTGVGLHGGYEMDPKEVAYGALVSALASGGKKIDQRAAQRVAEMLISRDPKVLAKGFKVVSGNGTLMKALRAADNRIAGLFGEQSPKVPLPQLPGASRASDQDQP